MLAKTYSGLLKALAAIGAVIIGLMSIWTTAEVVLRYGFSRPLYWAVDLSEYTLLCGTFLVAPWLLRIHGGHVTVTLVTDHLGAGTREWLKRATDLLAASACVVLAVVIGQTAHRYFGRGLVAARVWEVKLWPFYALMSFSCALMAIEFVRQALSPRHLQQPDVSGEASGDLL